jgi:hypothetical protein
MPPVRSCVYIFFGPAVRPDVSPRRAYSTPCVRSDTANKKNWYYLRVLPHTRAMVWYVLPFGYLCRENSRITVSLVIDFHVYRPCVWLCGLDSNEPLH